MTKRMILMLIALVIVFGGVFGYKAIGTYFMKQYFAHYQPPPVSVEVAPVQSRTWRDRISAPAGLSAIQGVTISNEVAGVVKNIHFQSGDEVNQGDLLVSLGDATEVADLAGLKAKAELTRLTRDREARLLKSNAAAATNYDSARAEYEAAVAAVQAQQALIAKKSIKAPFSGRLGIREINIGQYLTAGTPIVTLQDMHQLYADFTLPEQDLPRITKGLTTVVHIDTYPDRRFEGRITAVAPQVDSSSRNFRVQATLDNPEGLLRAGMFARVDVLLPARKSVLTVPSTAIAYNPYGDAVFLIKQGTGSKGKTQLTVTRQFVTTGAERDNRVEITSGLKAGDRVVTVGQLKLRNGSRVEIVKAPDGAQVTGTAAPGNG